MKTKNENFSSAQSPADRQWRSYRSCVLVLPISFFLMLGCADKKAPTSRPLTMRERQDAALRDPFGYKTDDMPSVSGGKTSEFDKQGFNHDVDRVLNP